MKSAKWWMSWAGSLWLSVGCALGATETIDGVTWSYTVAGETATVDGASPVEGPLTIPSKLGEFPVTSIGSYAFGDSFGLTSVTIPDSVTSIAAYAFQNCTGLKEVTVLGNVTNDWRWYESGGALYCQVPFFGCTNLETAVLGEKVTKIGSYMFDDCPNLASVTIPEGVTNIGSFAFWYTSLTDVTVPDSVRSIGTRSFYSCRDLTNVVIGKGVTSIGNEAFLECALESIEVSTNNPAYASQDGILFDKDMSTLIQYPRRRNGEAYAIPDGVVSLGDNSFHECTNLTSVTIPDSVTSIGSRAFDSCSRLYSVSIGSGVRNIGADAFTMSYANPDDWYPYYDTWLSEVHIHDLAAWCRISFANEKATPFWYAHTLFLNGEPLRDLLIPSGITKLGQYAFYGISGLTNVIISDDVTSIGSHAFDDCWLFSLTIGNGVKDIGSYAFNENSLRTVSIPDGVTTIGNWAFARNRSLEDVTIGTNVTQIGQCSFLYCTALTNVTIPTSVTQIGEGAFQYCKSLADATIPDGVTSIQSDLFQGCTSLAKVTIGAGVKSIGSEAFSYCEGLTSLIIPTNVTSIDKNALYGCSELIELYVPENWKGTTKLSGAGVPSECTVIYGLPMAEVVDGVMWHYAVGMENATIVSGHYEGDLAIPETLGGYPVTSVGAVAFAGCNGLENLMIPDGVTSIGRSAFAGCSGLSSVEIPDSVTNIGTKAFSPCTGLTNVTLGSGMRCIGTNAFSDCTALVRVTILGNVTGGWGGASPFSGCTALSTVVLGDAMTGIGAHMFGGCTGLTQMTIPEKVASIGAYAFYKTGLTELTIPAGVTNMGYGAFASCTALTNATILGNISNDWNDNSYETWEWDEFTGMMFPEYHSRDDYPFEGCKNLQTVVLKDTVGHIGNHMFEGCGLANVTIPESVHSMGYGAFADCTALTNVTILGNITNDWGRTQSETGATTDDYPFRGCTRLEKVVLGENLTRIGAWMFGACSHLATLTIPDGILNVGSSAFCGSGLKTLYVPVSWEGTPMLANAEVPADCKVVYGAAPADETTTSGVPHSWLDMNAAGILAANGGDYEAAANALAANGRAVWECYVAGLSTTEKEDDLKVELSFAGGTLKVESMGGGKDGRTYWTEGKKKLGDTDEKWTKLKEGEDWVTEGWRFFRVGAGLAE